MGRARLIGLGVLLALLCAVWVVESGTKGHKATRAPKAANAPSPGSGHTLGRATGEKPSRRTQRGGRTRPGCGSACNAPAAFAAESVSSGQSPAGAAATESQRPGCGSICQQLGPPAGEAGVCILGADPENGNAESLAVGARKVSVGLGGGPYRGDLLLVVVEQSDGATNGVAPPAGWSAIAGADAKGTGQRVQVFAKLATSSDLPRTGANGRVIFPTYTFTGHGPANLTAAIRDLHGVAQVDPIEAAAAHVTTAFRRSVTAPSVTSTTANARLVFIGAAPGAQTWRSPSGTTPSLLTLHEKLQVPISVATQALGAIGPSGERVATAAQPTPSIGIAIVVRFSSPGTCPRMTILSRGLIANFDGLTSVRLQCDWTADCRGVFTGSFVDKPDPEANAVASDFVVPAGATETVPLALTDRGRRYLASHPRIRVDGYAWVFQPDAPDDPAIAGYRANMPLNLGS